MRSEGSKRLAALDMTQREIAARIGVKQWSVGRWISGQCVPSEENQRAMHAAFGIPESCWPNEWPEVRDVIVRILASKAPALLEEIVIELEKLEAARN